MKKINLLSRAEMKRVMGGVVSTQFEPQDCYCTDGGNSFGCVTDQGCDQLTAQLCTSGQSICILK